MPVCIGITLERLWQAYAPGKQTGRFACPITLEDGRQATHIYQGFGALRLEIVSSRELNNGKKGFKGEILASISNYGRESFGLDFKGKVRIQD